MMDQIVSSLEMIVGMFAVFLFFFFIFMFGILFCLNSIEKNTRKNK